MLDTEALNKRILEEMERTGTPGVAIAIVYENQIAYAEGFGKTSIDPEQAVAVTPQTVFRIGSSTKPLTGTLLMRLVEAGKLSLDEPILTYLPWFTLSDPKATDSLTLRHLMSHQSGLPWGSQFFGSRDPEGLEAYVREEVPKIPLFSPPGTLFSYSNIGVNISGCVAQAVGGALFADLMQTWVFDPLAMERTTFDPLRAISFPIAQAHEKIGETTKVKRTEPWAENVAYHPSAMAFSTVLDMANFARLHLNQGMFEGRQLLSPDSVAEMHRTQADEYQIDGRTVGLNFALTHYRGYRRVGHPGGIASFVSFFTMLPDVKVAVLMQFNSGSFWQSAEEVVRYVFDCVLNPSSPQVPSISVPAISAEMEAEMEPEWLKRYVGTFLGPRSGLIVLSVTPDKKSLLLSQVGISGEAVLTLLLPNIYTGRNTITGVEEVVGFVPNDRAENQQYIMLNGTPCVRVEPNASFVPQPSLWTDYMGDYQGPDETYPSGIDILTLSCDNETLKILSRNRARTEEAIPWDADCFIYRGQFLRLVKDDSGKTTKSLTLGDSLALYHRV